MRKKRKAKYGVRPLCHDPGRVGCVSYKPGDEGFQEISAEITPINLIKQPFVKGLTHWDESRPVPSRRRNEEMDKL